MRIKFFFIGFFLSFPFWWGINIFQHNLEKFFYAQLSYPLQEINYLTIPKKPNLTLNAKSAISVKINKFNREKILFKNEIEKELPIASLTKLMTGLVVLDETKYDLENGWLTISEKAANQENVPIYGNLDTKKGETLKIKELLELMLVYSSNDAALALSEGIGTEEFVKKMNEKAEILGLKNTHFANPTGLEPENLPYNSETKNQFNYSTALDLARLAQYLLKEKPLIFEITSKEPAYRIENGIFDLFLGPGNQLIGGKTGYALQAGGCIILVFKDERENIFINVILGTESPKKRVEEMQKLIDWLNAK